MRSRLVLLVLLALLAGVAQRLAVAATTTPPPPEPYAQLSAARATGDAATLEQLAFEGSGYSAYSAASELAVWPQLPAQLRLKALERALELRIPDALLRAENLRLELLRAELAEAVGDTAKAIAAYRGVLPDKTALAGFTRLETDPYRLAAGLLDAGPPAPETGGSSTQRGTAPRSAHVRATAAFTHG